MKKIKYQIAALVLAGGLFSACSDDIKVGYVNEETYQTGEGTAVGYIMDSQGKRMYTTMELHGNATETLMLKATQTPSQDVVVTAVYDESVLTDYNFENDTEFEAFPQSDMELSDGGELTLEAGKTISSQLTVTLSSDGQRDLTKTYAIPLRLRVTSGNGTLPDEDQKRIIFVKDLTALPTATKYVDGEEGVKIFSCMEVNDANPLNNLNFTLKSNGKPLIDAVILFSSNINYDERTGRVYLFHNENCTAILNNYEKYLKPLKDRGIKVILSVLGNHDRSGVANLSDETARDFAREIKACCDAYNLDGVMLDDEYSKYEYSNITPGFVYPSTSAMSRLYYEMKKIMPDRWMITYVYGTGRSCVAVDGVQPGDYIDYALHDYGQSYDLTTNYPGLDKARWGLYSQEYTGRYFCSEANMQQLVNRGSRAHMIFAMDPNRSNVNRQIQSMQSMAKIFYKDELVIDYKFHPKDWN